jgi:hypothetical protein
MAKETSLSKRIIDICERNKNLNSALDDFHRFIKKEYDTQISFCEIYGKRWSFLTGSEKGYNTKERLKINDSYGLIYEKGQFSGDRLRKTKIWSKKIMDYYEE